MPPVARPGDVDELAEGDGEAQRIVDQVDGKRRRRAGEVGRRVEADARAVTDQQRMFGATAPTSTQTEVAVLKYCHWPVATLEPLATTAMPLNAPGDDPLGLPAPNWASAASKYGRRTGEETVWPVGLGVSRRCRRFLGAVADHRRRVVDRVHRDR